MSKVLVIPDIHVPFVHKDFLKFCRTMKKNYKPDVIVCLGDIVDNYAFSRFEQSPDAMTASQEIRKTIDGIKPWFELFPNVLACIGNHDLRLSTKMHRVGVPKEVFKTIDELISCPHTWNWANRHVVDGVQYIHGDGFSGRYSHVNAAERHRQNTVIGHCHHSAGVTFLSGNNGDIFGMNCGCGIDDTAYAFAYARNNPFKPVLGCGYVRDGKYPVFIPM